MESRELDAAEGRIVLPAMLLPSCTPNVAQNLDSAFALAGRPGGDMQQPFSVFIEQAAEQIAKLFNQVFPFAGPVQFRLQVGIFLAKKGTEGNFVITEKG